MIKPRLQWYHYYVAGALSLSVMSIHFAYVFWAFLILSAAIWIPVEASRYVRRRLWGSDGVRVVSDDDFQLHTFPDSPGRQLFAVVCAAPAIYFASLSQAPFIFTMIAMMALVFYLALVSAGSLAFRAFGEVSENPMFDDDSEAA